MLGAVLGFALGESIVPSSLLYMPEALTPISHRGKLRIEKVEEVSSGSRR